MTVSSQCDETHPLCKNCAKHFINIERCFFDPLGESEGITKDATKISTEAAFYQANPAHETNKKGGVKPRTARIQPAYQNMTTPAVVSNLDRRKFLTKSHESSLLMTVGAGQMDPFNTLPATKAPDADMLLGHCRHPLLVSLT